MTRLDSLVNALTERTGTEESTGKGVTGTVGVYDEGALEGLDGEGLGVLGEEVGRGRGRDGDDRGGGTLGDDDDAGGGLVVLGEGGELGGDGGNVLGLQRGKDGSGRRERDDGKVRKEKEERKNEQGKIHQLNDREGRKVRWTYVPIVGVSVSLGLGLVTDENVNVGKDLVNLGLEELGNERGGEVHGEGLHTQNTM